MPYPRVVVTGVGVVTPIGNNKNDFWNALVQGLSGVDKITTFDPHQFHSRIAGEIKNYNPTDSIPLKESKLMEKFSQFAGTAATEAIRDSGLDLKKENPFAIGGV